MKTEKAPYLEISSCSPGFFQLCQIALPGGSNFGSNAVNVNFKASVLSVFLKNISFMNVFSCAKVVLSRTDQSIGRRP